MKKIVLFLVSVFMIFLSASVFSATSQLQDVTEGKEIRGVTTSKDTIGYAGAYYRDNEYMLQASFENLSDPQGDDFYEGWAVRQSPFAFISTGKLVKQSDGTYLNTFTSSTDYSAYDFYVLTLEPNDGNDAPADHILEGNIVAHSEMMKKSDMGNYVTFDITGKNFEFSQDEIRVKKGDTVTINFESTSGFHDWGVDAFDAWTDRVDTGGTTSVTFVANQAGQFEYYCSVGSHRANGMFGTLIVEESENMQMQTMEKTMKSSSSDMMKSSMQYTEKQKVMRDKIFAVASKVSDQKISKVLNKAKTLQATIDSYNLSVSKKQEYNEILEVFISVLMEIQATRN